jgi:hypothetical protein
MLLSIDELGKEVNLRFERLSLGLEATNGIDLKKKALFTFQVISKCII